MNGKYGMTRRISRALCSVTISVFLIATALLAGLLYRNFTETEQNQLRTQTMLVAQGVSQCGEDYFTGLSYGSGRITWIQSDGTVIYDSENDFSSMDNHLNREEIAQAIKSGYGESSRYSDTLMERTLYAAYRLPDGTVLRMSVSQQSVFWVLMKAFEPIILLIALMLLLTMLISARLSKRVVQPLNNLNLDDPLSNEGCDEIAPLLTRMDAQQHQLRLQEAQLQKKQNEFDAVTENMGEGLILLNDSGVILSINRAAKNWLAADKECIGKEMLTVNRTPAVQKMLKTVLSGTGCELQLENASGLYQLDAGPVFSEGAVSGAVILMFDVTEKSKTEQMRREFTANVSHELKTPLHSISGYAELLAGGMVKQQDVGQFAQKIYIEAQRMIRLVEDIMRLSHLDEGEQDLKKERVDLYQLALDAVHNFDKEAAKQEVTLRVTGEQTFATCIPQFVSVMVCNLCDNAIKYNRPGGSVTVDIRNEKGRPTLTVSDTGIGISVEHQSRIFERFYRVDKSHSKDVGGTGLGLSIVKHAAKIHDAELSLHSVPGEGTQIAIHFPAENA